MVISQHLGLFSEYSQEIYRDTSQHDSHTSTGDDRLGVRGEDQEEGPEQHVDRRPNQVHLVDDTQMLV